MSNKNVHRAHLKFCLMTIHSGIVTFAIFVGLTTLITFLTWVTCYFCRRGGHQATMVCIPCIVVPVLLFIWHRFLQPLVLKFWNPWKKVTGTADAKAEGKDAANGCPASNGTAVANGGLSCPFSGKKEEATTQEVVGDKKND